jgi:hypothetical protein
VREDGMSGNLLAEHAIPVEPGGRLAALSPDGALCVSVTEPFREPGAAVVREVATGRERWRAPVLSRANPVFSPDGSRLTIDFADYDVATGRKRRRYEFGQSVGRPLAVSADGRLTAVSHGQTGIPIHVVETATNGLRLALDVPGFDPNQTHGLYAQFSRDGRYLLGSTGYRILIWSLGDGRLAFDEPWPNGAGLVAFSPDGRWLVQGNARDACVRVRDWKAGFAAREIKLPAPRAGLRSITFTPDGKTMLGGGEDGTVLVWDTSSFRALTRVFPRDWSRTELWDALAARDSAEAGRAVAELARRPEEAVALLAEKLPPDDTVSRIHNAAHSRAW